MKYECICVVCGRKDSLHDLPPVEAKYLCPKCYKKVKREFKKQNPGQSLRLKEAKKEWEQ